MAKSVLKVARHAIIFIEFQKMVKIENYNINTTVIIITIKYNINIIVH